MKNRIFYICMSAALLFGCTENMQPRKALPEQLAGKTPRQRQEILRLDCLNAAEKITGRTSMWESRPHGEMPIYDAKVEEIKDLCRQMTDAYLLQDQPQHIRLKKECDSLLQTVKVNQRNAQALENMRQVCKAMAKG